MKPKLHIPLPAFAGAGLLVGLLGNALWSAERVSWPAPLTQELRQLTRLEPVRVLPFTELSLVALEARQAMDEGRPWRAWRLLREHVDRPEAAAGHVVLAARAAAGWGAWDHVRELLNGREWLERVENGEGLLLLGRAEEELGHREAATAAYRRYVALPSVRSRGEAYARLGKMLSAAGDARGAAAAFEAAATQLPDIQDWLRALQVEQLAAAQEPTAISLGAVGTSGSAPTRLRRVMAEVKARVALGDHARALRRLEWEGRVLRAQDAVAEAAQLQLERARLLIQAGRADEARELLRATAWEGGVPGATRAEAAGLLGELDSPTAADELARAAAYEAGGKPGLAARSLRAAMQLGAPDQGGLQLRLARLLYSERDFGPARVAFRKAAEELREPELVAEAHLYAARSLYRSGSRGNAEALAEMRRVVEQYEGTAAAGTALFLLGDAASSLESAVAYYRRAAAVRHAPEAREALFRVGDRSLKLKNVSGAIRAWEDYVERYPRGEETARVSYQTGRLHERAGRESRARAMYTAALLAEPLSYYAFRAGERLGADALDRILAEPKPWVGLASDQVEAAQVLKRLDALEGAGLSEEWSQELGSALRVLHDRPAALIALAEGLRDRGRPVESIRLGRQLLERRDGEWDVRLLRVVFPFPYRHLVEEEARRVGVDPMLLAGLIRQESSFRADARSWVGATGLGQIMPATGRWLAGAVGVRPYEERLLEVPEVNLRMGARYLADMLNRYDGAADLALAAYNAGPGRADRWRRELNHGRDTDAFREAIPFDETRHYVKVVLRNAAVYSRLYGGSR